MTLDQAVLLIEKGIQPGDRIWADLGAGAGLFTMALNEILGFEGIIFAIDQRLEILRQKTRETYLRSTVHLYEESFTEEMPFLPELDGILLANAIHYVPNQEQFLASLCKKHLKPGGALLVIEYDRYEKNSYVPYPLPLAHFERICSNLAYPLPEEIGRHPSIYGGHEIYAAVCHPG